VVMKFGKKLLANATNEWQSKFIDYKKMKKKAKAVKARIEYAEHEKKQTDLNNEILGNRIALEDINEIRIFIETNNRFFTQEIQDQLSASCLKESRDLLDTFEAEIEKINSFFKGILSEYKLTHKKLALQLEAKERCEREGKKTASNQKIQLQKAFQEHYRSLVLLENYRSWNFLGCGKSIKKFIKCAKCPAIQEPLTEMVRTEDFFSGTELDDMMYETVSMFMTVIDGSRKRAMAMLRIPVNSGSAGPHSNSTIMRSGVLFGASVILTCMSLYVYIRLYIMSIPTGVEPGDDLVFLYFRLLFFPVLLTVAIAINLKIWSESNINYVFIFEMDARRHLTVWEFTELAFVLYLLWIGFFTLYLFLVNTLHEFTAPWSLPLTLFLLYTCFILFPAPILFASARRFLMRIILKSIAAPFIPVRFQDFWFVNQCTSLSDVIHDMQIIYCIYAPEPNCEPTNKYFITILMLVPVWLRAMQCLRRYRDSRDVMQLLNLGKYVVTIIAMMYTFIFKQILLYSDLDFESVPIVVPIIWFGILIINTLYKYIWDIVKDWGLLRVFTWKHFLLRNTLMQRALWYYLALVLNLLVRMLWFIVFLLRYNIPSRWWDTEFMLFGLLVAEVLRRFIWNIFRLENEHLHNADNFRVVSEIPLPFPMDVEANAREDREYRQQLLNNIKDKLTGFSGPIGAFFRKVWKVEDDSYSDEEEEAQHEKEREMIRKQKIKLKKKKAAKKDNKDKEEKIQTKKMSMSKSVPVSLNHLVNK
jgi:hypothetical protein